MADQFTLSHTPPGPEVTFLDQPYQVLEENSTLEVCFNVTRNSYQGDLNYTFAGASAQGVNSDNGQKKLHFIIHLIFHIAGVDFIAATTNVPVLEEPVVTICATLDVIDDSLLEDNELLQLVINAGGLEYLAIITILDTVDSECTASYSIPLQFCNMCTHYNIIRVPFCPYYVSLQEYII